MKNTKKIGDKGEDRAVLELEILGYEILDRNFRTRFGEIDIIARAGQALVFVEVKAKSGRKYGTPAEMITKNKLHKIKNMALLYIQEEKYEGPWRIDAVTIEGDIVEIIKNISS